MSVFMYPYSIFLSFKKLYNNAAALLGGGWIFFLICRLKDLASENLKTLSKPDGIAETNLYCFYF